MANTAAKVSALPVSVSLIGTSKIPVVDGATGNTSYVTLANFFANTAANVAVRATRLLSGVSPANSTSNGISGDIAWDSGFVYICVATNTWKRAPIATW